MVSAEELRNIADQVIINDPMSKIIQIIVDETDILVNAAKRGEFSKKVTFKRTPTKITCSLPINKILWNRGLLAIPHKYFEAPSDIVLEPYRDIKISCTSPQRADDSCLSFDLCFSW